MFFQAGDDQSPEAQDVKIERLLSTVKQHSAIVAIDWHARTSYPSSRLYREWGKTYLTLLDRISADDDLQVWTFGETLEKVRQQYKLLGLSIPNISQK